MHSSIVKQLETVARRSAQALRHRTGSGGVRGLFLVWLVIHADRVFLAHRVESGAHEVKRGHRRFRLRNWCRLGGRWGSRRLCRQSSYAMRESDTRSRSRPLTCCRSRAVWTRFLRTTRRMTCLTRIQKAVVGGEFLRVCSRRVAVRGARLGGPFTAEDRLPRLLLTCEKGPSTVY